MMSDRVRSVSIGSAQASAGGRPNSVIGEMSSDGGGVPSSDSDGGSDTVIGTVLYDGSARSTHRGGSKVQRWFVILQICEK